LVVFSEVVSRAVYLDGLIYSLLAVVTFLIVCLLSKNFEIELLTWDYKIKEFLDRACFIVAIASLIAALVAVIYSVERFHAFFVYEVEIDTSSYKELVVGRIKMPVDYQLLFKDQFNLYMDDGKVIHSEFVVLMNYVDLVIEIEEMDKQALVRSEILQNLKNHP
jgi:hypothetical protein